MEVVDLAGLGKERAELGGDVLEDFEIMIVESLVFGFFTADSEESG